jgi:hypothetical protein
MTNLATPAGIAGALLACGIAYGLWDQGYRSGYAAGAAAARTGQAGAFCQNCMAPLPAEPTPAPALQPGQLAPMMGGRRY